MPACEQTISDIEDIINVDDVTPHERYNNKAKVVPKVHRRKKKTFGSNGEEGVIADSVIPGTQSVFVKTWGCSHNNSDGEYMAGQLAAYGYKITDNGENADLWLLNSCTVKSPAEDFFRNEITKAQEKGKYLVLSGCVPQAQPRAGYLQGVSAVGVQQIDRVVEVVEETLKGHTVRLFGQKKSEGKKIGGARLDLPKIRKNPLIEILAINTGYNVIVKNGSWSRDSVQSRDCLGRKYWTPKILESPKPNSDHFIPQRCLNQCTYCKTKHARGELGSYPIEDLVQRAKQSFQEGICEIWLTSEDTGAYGIDIGVTIVDLLWKLVEVIPEGCMMRIGMTNPPYILEHLEEMAKILNHPRVYAFLHVPVQAASDSVLMDMKREYCLADFKQVVEVLKERVPGVTIATDVICGFPTETDEDFQETVELVRQYKFPSLFINQFFPRPGTPAAKMPQLDAQERKKRTKQISTLFKSYHPYDHKLGEIQRVLVTEVSHDKQFWVGHNKFYEQVLVPKEEGLLGKMVEVEIISTGKHYMMSEIIREKELFTPSVATPLAQGEISGLPKKVTSPSVQRSFWFPFSVMLVGIAVIYELIRIGYQLVQR